jgi:hypothetical protein
MQTGLAPLEKGRLHARGVIRVVGADTFSPRGWPIEIPGTGAARSRLVALLACLSGQSAPGIKQRKDAADACKCIQAETPSYSTKVGQRILVQLGSVA